MIHFAVGLFFVLIGYLIKCKELSWLIAGYNTASEKEKRQYDVKALCTAVGNLMLILGGLCIIGVFGEVFRKYWLISACWILITMVTVGAVIYLNTGNRFKKS